MLGWYSHFCVAFGADGSLAQLAGNAARAENSELRSQAEETKLSLLDILFDVNADGKTFELRFGDHGTNVNDFLQRQRQPVGFELVAPLMLVQRVFRPRVHRAEICRRILLRSSRWLDTCCDRCNRRLILLSRLPRLRTRRRNWLTIGYLETLTANNRVTTNWCAPWLTLRRQIVSCKIVTKALATRTQAKQKMEHKKMKHKMRKKNDERTIHTNVLEELHKTQRKAAWTHIKSSL